MRVDEARGWVEHRDPRELRDDDLRSPEEEYALCRSREECLEFEEYREERREDCCDRGMDPVPEEVSDSHMSLEW